MCEDFVACEWCAPAWGKVKVNVDGGLLKDVGVGLDVVIRNSVGEVLVCGVSQLAGVWDPKRLEAGAILFSMKHALDHGFRELEVENTSLGVIKAINYKEEVSSWFHLIVDDILDLSNSFNSCSWCFIGKLGNKVAQFFAPLSPWEVGTRV